MFFEPHHERLVLQSSSASVTNNMGNFQAKEKDIMTSVSRWADEPVSMSIKRFAHVVDDSTDTAHESVFLQAQEREKPDAALAKAAAIGSELRAEALREHNAKMDALVAEGMRRLDDEAQAKVELENATRRLKKELIAAGGRPAPGEGKHMRQVSAALLRSASPCAD